MRDSGDVLALGGLMHGVEVALGLAEVHVDETRHERGIFGRDVAADHHQVDGLRALGGDARDGGARSVSA